MANRLWGRRRRIDQEKLYGPREALELLKKGQFDESVGVSLNVDPRRADQMVGVTHHAPERDG